MVMHFPDVIKQAIQELNLDPYEAVQREGISEDNVLGAHGHVLGTSSAGLAEAIDIIPPELKQAYQKGDYKVINDIRNQINADLKPIFHNFEKHENNAWISAKDPNTQRTLYLCTSGPPNRPDAWMWVYALGDISSTNSIRTLSDSRNNAYVNTIQIGTLTRNSRVLGISNIIWDNNILDAGIFVATSAVAWFYGSYISTVLKRIRVPDPISNAVGRVLLKLPTVYNNAAKIAAWAANSKTIRVFRSGLIGLVFTLLFKYLADFVYRTYRISVNIYNWTTRSFAIDSFYGSNEQLSGDDKFLVGAIPAITGSVPLPGDFGPIASTNGSVVSYASYTYENVNKVLEGLGVGLQVIPLEGGSGGFRLKYNLRRFKSNQIGLIGSSPSSPNLVEWFKDDKAWEADGKKLITSSLADGTPVLAMTPDLGGRSDQLYDYDVHIGLRSLPGAMIMADAGEPFAELHEQTAEEQRSFH